MTPMRQAGSWYDRAMSVPTVSFTSARMLTTRPARRQAASSSATTSWSTTPLAVNPLVHVISVPASSAVWFTGNEKVKPTSAPAAIPASTMAVATKSNSSLALDAMVASGMTRRTSFTTASLPPPPSATCTTRRLLPPMSTAHTVPVSVPVGRPVTKEGIMRMEEMSPFRPCAISPRKLLMTRSSCSLDRPKLSRTSCSLAGPARGSCDAIHSPAYRPSYT